MLTSLGQEILFLTAADGRHELDLPPATYAMTAHGTSPAGKDMRGEVAGVVVTAGSHVTVDITVTEEDG